MIDSLEKYVPRSMVDPYILVYKKKNNMLVLVSSASATSYNLSGSTLNPELMNKYDAKRTEYSESVFSHCYEEKSK